MTHSHNTHRTRSNTPVAPLPPSPSLVAILLVIRSLSLGPRLIFHYPASVASSTSSPAAATAPPSWFANGTTTSTATDDNDSDTDELGSSKGFSSDDDGIGADAASVTSGGRGGSARGTPGGGSSSLRGRGAWRERDVVDTETVDDDEVEGRGRNGRSIAGGGTRGKSTKEERDEPEWERVLGFRAEALEKMLAPGRNFNKRRFEIGVEGLVFVGAPMFVRDDGGWKKRLKKRQPAKDNKPQKSNNLQEQDRAQNGEPGIGINLADSEEVFGIEYPVGYEPAYGHGLDSEAVSAAASDAGSDAKSASTTGQENEMTMFNIVFVLNPPALEYQLRVKEMYDNVVKKLAKALKYEQARFNYVWEQSKKILSMKNKAKEKKAPLSTTWHSIIASSPLAKSIAIIYDSISNSKIAHVHLDSTFETSFQIPQAISTPYISSTTEPQMPGLWLTTANIIDEDAETTFTQHSALLLLEDAETLVREIEGDAKEHTTPLASYIRVLTPTKSLQKLSITNSIPAQDMEFIAGHLCYWRRARLIPPLHPQNTYIASPNANMHDLVAAIPAYAARFPTFPSLLNMLHKLSGQPIQYGRIIPTRDHRAAYMEILAWLMRGGWVTQLRTFAYVRVSAEVKATVSMQMERETKEKKEAEEKEASRRENSSPARGENPKESRGTIELADRRALPLRISSPLRQVTDADGPPSTPQRRPSPGSPSTSTTQRTTGRSPNPLAIQSFSPSIIPSPRLATSLEARWLEYIGARFSEPEIGELWPILLRYFDGRHAIEDIALREGLKRKRVWNVWNMIKDADWLVCVKHW